MEITSAIFSPSVTPSFLALPHSLHHFYLSFSIPTVFCLASLQTSCRGEARGSSPAKSLFVKDESQQSSSLGRH